MANSECLSGRDEAAYHSKLRPRQRGRLEITFPVPRKTPAGNNDYLWIDNVIMTSGIIKSTVIGGRGQIESNQGDFMMNVGCVVLFELPYLEYASLIIIKATSPSSVFNSGTTANQHTWTPQPINTPELNETEKVVGCLEAGATQFGEAFSEREQFFFCL